MLRKKMKMEIACMEVMNHLAKIYSEVTSKTDGVPDGQRSLLDKLLNNLATPPSYTVLRVNNLQSSRENVTKKLQEALEKQYEAKCSTPPVVSFHPSLPDVVFMKNSGPHVNLERHAKEVIVDLVCGMAVMRGADVFAQGIMGAGADVAKGDPVSVYADIDGTCKKGLVKAFDGRKLFVGNGVAQLSRKELYCDGPVVSGVGVLMTSPLYSAPCLSDLLLDKVFAQNLPSIVCSHVLNPQPGETILDMCAAPGGKTNHIATLMSDTGVVIALDKAKQKIGQIKGNAKRWSLQSIQAFAYDSTKACDPDVQSIDLSSGPPFGPNSFDRILLDTPCSALGQRPSLKNKMTMNELVSYPKYQRRLFSQAVSLVKPGGILVYSTCTLTLAENEELVEWALRKHPQMVLVSQEPKLGGDGLEGSQLATEQLPLLQRFDPSCLSQIDLGTVDNDTLGFFIAKFMKR